jgi:predicted nucleic acid-binding Zn ribbon protein
MFCPECGKYNDDKRTFCSECGIFLRKYQKKQVQSKSSPTIKWSPLIIIVLFLLIIGIFSPGILDLANLLDSNFFGSPNLHLGEFNIEPDIWSGKMVYKFQVYNSGNGNAQNVYASIGIENTITGNIIASKEVFVGNLKPGESRTITASLNYDGDYKNIKNTVSLSKF